MEKQNMAPERGSAHAGSSAVQKAILVGRASMLQHVKTGSHRVRMLKL
jgi:hypothetical protein